MFVTTLVSYALAKETLGAVWVPAERQLRISVDGVTEPGVEVRVSTDGLRNFERGGDVNEPGIIYLPPAADPLPAAENFFFFNDLVTADGWDLVICFDASTTGSWKLNGRFSSQGGAIQSEVVVPVNELEVGENLLHVTSSDLRAPRMYFKRGVAAGQRLSSVLAVDDTEWAGNVTLVRVNEEKTVTKLADTTITGSVTTSSLPAIDERWWRNRGALVDAALGVGRNLIDAQVKRPGSLFHGGFNLVYDVERHAHRIPHWIWAWGPSIHLLLKLEKLDAAKAAGLSEQFRAAAVTAGERSLAFEMTDPKHRAFGISTVRWEPSRATPLGWAEYVSTADSLFLAGWGWMSLYHKTNDPVYLARTKSLVTSASRLMSEYPVIPQDWIVERDRWTPHTLDESVFGTIAFRRLFEATAEPTASAAGRTFLDSHLKHMGRESGLLERAWMREENKPIWDPDIKGHAWVIEGYLDTFRLSGERKYLDLARALADRVIACQADDGGWTYLFKTPAAGDFIDDKGTAIWAYLFYDLYKVSRSPGDLAAARRALGWCLRHQYRGGNPHLDGALLHTNSMAYVRRRPMTILYSTTFFGLAMLEELSLPDELARK